MIAIAVVAILSVLLIVLSLFDDFTGEWKYNERAIRSIIVPGYPIVLSIVASAILFSCGQLHWRKTEMDWDKYKGTFGISCFLFFVFFLPKLISAIFNFDGLYYDDRWEKVASSGTIFAIASYIGNLVTMVLLRKNKGENK